MPGATVLVAVTFMMFADAVPADIIAAASAAISFDFMNCRP
jgi:hypothetical protein